MESKPENTERSLDFEDGLVKKEFPTTDIETLPRSGFLERLFNSSDQNGNFRKVTLSGFLECNEEAKFVVVIAKFISILGINIREIACLSKLSAKEHAYIQDYNLESILADTNRKLFYKFFSKTLCPTISLSPYLFSIESGIAIFIGDQEDPKEKGIIKIMNFEGFLHSILNNVKLGEGLEQFSKFLDSRYKRLGTIICYERVKNKSTKSEIICLLLKKFREVIHVCVYENEFQVSDEVESRSVLENHKMMISTSENYEISSTNSFSPKAHESIFQYYNRHTSINNFIHKLLDRSKMEREVFNENEICITYFGVLYNYLSMNWKPKITMQEVEEAFLKKLIEEKIEYGDGTKKEKKKILTRKLGHYPIKIEKGSKVCCVCDDSKKKKTRFRCEKCSDTFSRDIAICIGHFKEFHSNVHKYIPKGVRKGAYENELLMFKEEQNNPLGPASNKNNHANDLTNNYEKIMKKWTTNFIDGELQMGILGSYLSDQRMEKFCPPQYLTFYHPPMPFPAYYPDPHMFEFKEDPEHNIVPHFLNNIGEHPENKIEMQKYEPNYDAKNEISKHEPNYDAKIEEQ